MYLLGDRVHVDKMLRLGDLELYLAIPILSRKNQVALTSSTSSLVSTVSLQMDKIAWQ